MDFAGGIKLRILRWKIILDYTDGPMSSQGSLADKARRVRGGDVTTEAEVSSDDAFARKEHRPGSVGGLQQLEKARNRLSPGASRRKVALPTP